MITRTLYNIYKQSLLILCLASVAACTDELGTDQPGTENPLNQDKGIGELVLFSSGNTGNITTRANVIPYMEKEGRFVCKMYYHSKVTDTDDVPFETVTTPITSWLRVNNQEGNSVYWQKDFDMDGVDQSHQDYLDYGFDSRAQYFYWRNRLDHVFLAYTDYNLLKSNKYQLSDKTDEEGKPIPAARSLFMYPEADGAMKIKVGVNESSEDIFEYRPANIFDLTRGDKTSMTQQPDPMIALTKMKPTGATQEANRVRLYFKHQFSQIQVNLTNAENTAEISADNIVSVELLGVSKKGYVFTNINPDGTQIPPSYDPVVISQFTEEQLKENQYGTSFNMFKMDDSEKPLTSLKSFNAITFGQLQAIRITWKEEDYKDEEGNDVEGVKHVATYKITVDDRGNSLVNLKSGFRYMYDFELRRGTIAFIRAEIIGWLTNDELDYGTSGTINE